MVPLECQSAKRKKPTITISIGYQMLITKSRVCVMTLPRWRAPKRKMFFIKWKGRKETKCQWTETNSKLSQYYKWKMGRKTNRMQQTRIYRRKPKSKEIGKRSKKQVRRKTEKSRFLYCYATRDKKIFDRTKRANQLIGIGKTTDDLIEDSGRVVHASTKLVDRLVSVAMHTPTVWTLIFRGLFGSTKKLTQLASIPFFFSSILCVYVCVCVCVLSSFTRQTSYFKPYPPHDWTIRWKENLYFGRNEGHFRLTGSVPLRPLGRPLSSRPAGHNETLLTWQADKQTTTGLEYLISAALITLNTHTHTHSITSQIGKDNRNGKS